MTSLKIKYANEIAEAMANTLGDEGFTNVFHKQASVKKEAGAALEAYKSDLASARDADGLRSVWSKHISSLEKEENVEEGAIQAATCAQAAKAKELNLPGYQVPGCADDMQMAEDKCEKAEKEEDADDQFSVAANFALTHLSKLASTLDGKGFSKIADVIDEAMKKIAEKK